MSKTILIVVGIFILSIIAVYFIHRMAEVVVFQRVRCIDFKTQSEAQAAYEHGATYLDGNNNKKACEALQ